MALGFLISSLLVIISLVYFWVRRRYSFFERNGFLYEEPSFPFGNIKGVGKDTHLAFVLQKAYNKFRGKAKLFGLYFFIKANVVITDLDLIKDILIKDFDAFHNRGLYSNEVDDPLTGHLFLLEDAAWKNLRSKLTPTFTSGKMKMMFKTLVDVSNEMIDQLKSESNLDSVEMKSKLAKYTTDVIGNVAFGLEMNSIKNPDSKFHQMGKKIFTSASNFQLKAFLLATFSKIGRLLHCKLFSEEISDFFMGTIRETVDYRVKNKIQRNDMMDLLIKMKEQEGTLTFNQLAAQCFIFFIGGFETSSSTASFSLYFLSINQDIQDKVRKEIDDTLAKHGNQLTYEAMQEMKYLEMIIDETLRMFGPANTVVRVASRDYKIPNSDLTIPQGTLTMIPIYAIHHDSNIYPEPEKFDPERFSEENKKKRHPMAHLPFGDGPRNCIGMRFGLMQTKIALIKLLTNFKFSTSPQTPIPMKINVKSFIFAPQGDMWLKVEKL